MIEELLTRLLERTENRYYGKYRGYVSKVDDPKGIGRIKAVVPRLLGDTESGWALPCAPYAGPDQGFFTVPEVGSGVWVEFEGGDLSRPIWSGMWWGSPDAAEIGTAESSVRPTDRNTEGGSEVPKHAYPAEVATPGVRILKSGSGHYIVMDDRTETGRLELHDRDGNRYIFSSQGLERLISNERTVNEGNQGSQIDGDVRTAIGGKKTQTVGKDESHKIGGDLLVEVTGTSKETVGAVGYERTVDDKGLTQIVGGPKTERIRGSAERNVVGKVQETAVGGYGVTAGGSVNIASGSAVHVAAAMADGPNAVSIDAGMGNISINTFLGVCQLGGLSAVSPIVLGDGLSMHFAMLVQILKLVNPITLPAYGPLLDTWAAMSPLVDWSLFGFVKRFPVG